MALALRAGVPLKDMEMVQFHPTTLPPSGVLITEGCRGEGAYLLNKDGERFMAHYAPRALELASRDVISRAEQTEIDEGRGLDGSVWLDLRHLGAEKIMERLPSSRELAITFTGVDPIYDPVPVRPGQHYMMGGVATDVWEQTELEGLYAAGEVACVSVHGANRLGGNALMERSPSAGVQAAMPPSGRSRTRPCRFPERPSGRRSGSCARYSTAATASGRGGCATSSPRRCTRTSAFSAANSR
jgi:succinate dehydrogenase/fumarate reductase flavoprotein subunit